jgi:hypothetical protein
MTPIKKKATRFKLYDRVWFLVSPASKPRAATITAVNSNGTFTLNRDDEPFTTYKATKDQLTPLDKSV